MTDIPSDSTALGDEDALTVQCPECDCEMVVDRKTGRVLVHKAKPPEIADFGELLAGVKKKKAENERNFDAEMEAFGDRERLLEAKFKQALKKADEIPDEDVIRPWDLD